MLLIIVISSVLEALDRVAEKLGVAVSPAEYAGDIFCDILRKTESPEQLQQITYEFEAICAATSLGWSGKNAKGWPSTAQKN